MPGHWRTTLKQRLPFGDGADRLMHTVRRARIRARHRAFAAVGLVASRRDDYYSVLPALPDLQRHRQRWEKPSTLTGVRFDRATGATRLRALSERWATDLDRDAGRYADNQRRGFGPGIPEFDARVLYYMIREHAPARYLEIGSGLSTYYATLAARHTGTKITCVEPHPYAALHTLEVELIETEAQNVPVEKLTDLAQGDVLFIDSSHALKIDSDVAYLHLEVLPQVAPGVFVHIHDVPFPFNTPYPADMWIFGERPPMYWQEAMLVQAFLAFNDSFEILLSVPMLRHHDEAALRGLPGYTPLSDTPDPPSSLWMRRTG